MKAYILRFDGTETVSDSFRHAMRSAAVMLLPDAGERERVRALDASPALTEINAAGSFSQMLRYRNEATRQARFEISEHVVGGPPGEATLAYRFDMNDGIDPSYEVQAALWDLAFEGRNAIADTSAAIEAFLREGVAAMRAAGTEDRDILDGLAHVEERMGGLKVIPPVGTPSSVLDRLPGAAADAFASIAREAFPDRK